MICSKGGPDLTLCSSSGFNIEHFQKKHRTIFNQSLTFHLLGTVQALNLLLSFSGSKIEYCQDKGFEGHFHLKFWIQWTDRSWRKFIIQGIEYYEKGLGEILQYFFLKKLNIHERPDLCYVGDWIFQWNCRRILNFQRSELRCAFKSLYMAECTLSAGFKIL